MKLDDKFNKMIPEFEEFVEQFNDSRVISVHAVELSAAGEEQAVPTFSS